MDATLWNNISDFDLDNPLSAYSFSTRLAAENFWTINFTKQAIVEYKKFMYLAGTSESMVSPSPIIDIVWHEHLTFTQSYTDFCKVLGKTIQHVPSTRSKVDEGRFRQAKERTDKLYRDTFGEAPASIWKYEDMYASLELPKAGIKVRTFLLIAILVFIGLVVPSYMLLYPYYIEINSDVFLTTYALSFFAALTVLRVVNHFYLERVFARFGKHSFVRHLHPMELIYLKEKMVHHVVHATVNQMTIEKKLKMKDLILQVVDGAEPKNPVEWSVFDVVKQDTTRSLYPAITNKLVKMPVFTNIPNATDALKKYFNKSKAFGLIFYLNTFVYMVLLMFGVVRLLTGIMRDRPVGLIALVLIIAALVVLIYLVSLSNAMTKRTIPSYYTQTYVRENPAPLGVEWQYFALGAAFLTPAMQPAVKRWQDSSSSSFDSDSSSSSSDSGSSCSSGCGSSCGGCGGGGD